MSKVGKKLKTVLEGYAVSCTSTLWHCTQMNYFPAVIDWDINVHSSAWIFGGSHGIVPTRRNLTFSSYNACYVSL